MRNTPAGLMQPPVNASELLAAFRAELGPTSTKTYTLEERLEALSPEDVQFIMGIAKSVKGMQPIFARRKQSYQSMVKALYPNLNDALSTIIAEVLQDSDPLPEIEEDIEPKTLRVAQVKPKRVEITNEQIAEFEAEIQERYPDSFLEQLAQIESSGQADAEITINDGRTFTGIWQFGDARLSDYREATGAKFTTQEFKEDLELQQTVADWHIKDIDKAIDSLGDEAKDYDRDGLRSVAHLGGVSGMKKFVRTKGKYDPQDELGTSLSDYYKKFSA